VIEELSGEDDDCSFKQLSSKPRSSSSDSRAFKLSIASQGSRNSSKSMRKMKRRNKGSQYSKATIDTGKLNGEPSSTARAKEGSSIAQNSMLEKRSGNEQKDD